MTSYCFLEGKRAIWSEMVLRGWLAAILDFPRRMDMPTCEAAVQGIPDELRPEICCIQDDTAYRHLVANAWANGYLGTLDCTERQLSLFAIALKRLPPGEAMASLRRSAANSEAREVIDESWQKYIDTIEGTL